MSIMTKIFGKKEKNQTTEEITHSMQTSDQFETPSNDNSNLDINLVISAFQDKLTQVMTELVVKEATIKQLMLQIEKLKGR